MEKLKQIFTDHYILSQEWLWTIFGITVVVLLVLDLCVFNRKNEIPNFVHTFWLCMFYIFIACVFGVFVIYERGFDMGMLFFTGFLVEKSLSLDNIFVMSLIFTSLGIPREYRHRILFWGILGAVVMRALFILAGEALITRFEWILYVFSFFLIYTGIKMLRHDDAAEVDLEKNKLYIFLSKIFPVTKEIHGHHFFVKLNGKHYITPLFLALLLIEFMDVVFAFDSIPAIFLITTDIFIVYTSNIFAILGLRALYFLLEVAVNRFAYLKPALSAILIFIGMKIFLPKIGIEVEAWHSLVITFSLLTAGVVVSLLKEDKKQA